MPQPTLAPRGVIGVLVPWGNTTTQLEVAPLTPAGVCDAVGRFEFGPGVDLAAELAMVAEKLTYAEPSAMLLSLSPEMGEGGLERVVVLRESIAAACGIPTFTTTEGTFWDLRDRGLTRIGLVTPAPADRTRHAASNFEAEGFEVINAVGLDCGLPNIKATPLAEIAEAFLSVDHPDVEAFVQVGTGLPAFAVAETIEAELGRPVITTAAAGYRQLVTTLGLNNKGR